MCGLTVQAHYLSGYSHYSTPQSPAQLPLNLEAILWLNLEMEMGLGQGIISGDIFLHAQ